MSFRMTDIRIESVRVVGRHRKDLGDIAALAESIKTLDLLNPITITPDNYLIAGQRRLEAFRLLGRETIPARIADSLDAAVERLRAERDENTSRKPMTPGELVSLGLALEQLERPKARERQGRGRWAPSLSSGEDNDGSPPPKTDAVVADAIGMSQTTYHRARTVVNAASDPALSAEHRQVARKALDEMNATGRIAGAYERVRALREPPKQTNTLRTPKEQRKAMGGALLTLAGLTHGLKQIDPIHPEITKDEAAQWVSGLVEARQTITVLIKRLKGVHQC